MAQKEKGGEHMWQWWTYGCYMDTGWCRGAGPLPIPAVITMDEETTAVGAALHTQPALVVELDQIAVSQNSPFLLYMWGADRFLPFEIGTILHLHPFLLYIWGADRFLPFEIGTRLHLHPFPVVHMRFIQVFTIWKWDQTTPIWRWNVSLFLLTSLPILFYVFK